MYKKIDISQCGLYFVSEECAQAFIEWRIQTKKGITQRIFDNTLKQAVVCSQHGLSAEDAIDRVMESGWSGMKYVLAEAKREAAEQSQGRSTRDRPLAEDLTDRSWAEVPANRLN